MTLKILIVEDEAFVAIELESILMALGHEVVGIASTSKDALRISAERPMDMALVDVHLKDGPTGPIVARKLAEEATVTVLFTTCNPSRIPNDFANACGALAKPYSDRDIKAAIEFLVSSRSAEGPLRKKPHTLTLAPKFAEMIASRGH